MKILFLLSTLGVVGYAYVGACGRGMYWDMNACQCFKVDTCAAYVKCGFQMIPDPRFDCKCSPIKEVEALYEHAGYDENCEKIIAPVPKSKPSPNFSCDDQGKKICLI